MVVSGLDAYLRERNLIREAPLSALKDTRLGIDAHHWFSTLLADPRYQEPCVSVTGGAPLNAYPVMENQLRALEAARIKPVFVFHGLQPSRRERPFVTGGGAPPDVYQQRLRLRAEGWERYVQAGQQGAMALFAQSSSVQPADILNQIHRLFRTRQVEYLVAPYFAWAQLVYLERHPKAYIHAIAGANELLMFDGVERLILGVDFDRSVVRFVTKSSLLADLGPGVGPDQFLDMAVLAGFDHSPMFPFFSHTLQYDFNFRQAVDLVRQYRQGLLVVQAYSDFVPVQRTGYIEHFSRARGWIKLSLITAAEEGRVTPLPLALTQSLSGAGKAAAAGPLAHLAEVPSDLHDLFTFRFPDEVYFQLCRAMVGPTLLNVLASGLWVEHAPLCGGETDDYHHFVQARLTQDPVGPRCTALALVALPLNPFWQQRQSAIYYFEPHQNHLVPFMSPTTVQLVKRVTTGWKVPAVVIEEELKRQNSSTIDILLCLGATAEPSNAARTRARRVENGGGPATKDGSSAASSPATLQHPHHHQGKTRPLEKKDEVVANALWRLLELRGFLSADHLHTPLGSALHKALKGSKVNDKLQEPLLLVIELVRAEVLHAGRYGGRSWVGSAHRGTEVDQRCLLLVMRTLSVLPLQFKPMAWQGPLSRDLLVFNSFARSMGRALRLLIEATLLSLVVRNDARRSREDGMEVGLSLPFQADANTGMGILFKGYADMMLQEREEKEGEEQEEGQKKKEGLVWGFEEEELRQTKADILEGAQEGFPMVRDVATELNRGFRFWDAVMTAMRSLRQDKVVSEEVVDRFEDADRWLIPLRLQ